MHTCILIVQHDCEFHLNIINHPAALTSWIIPSYVLTSISIKIIVCSFNLRDLCCTWWVQLRLQSLLGLIYICMCIFILQVGTNVHKEASSCRIWKVKHFRLESANTSMYIMTVFLKTWSRNYNRKWKRKVDTEIKAIWNAIEVTLLTNFRITWACTGLHAPVGIVSHMHIYELQQAPFGPAIVSRYM